jgi:hypothetical protein
MGYSDETLNWIYDRTDGRCHLCSKRLSFFNYAQFGCRGAWEVEHSIPRSRGGTDHLNNLFGACIGCNRSKATCSTRVVRSQSGLRRAPYCKAKKEQIRKDNSVGYGAMGALLGSVAGPWGTAIGAFVGSNIGNSIDPEN